MNLLRIGLGLRGRALSAGNMLFAAQLGCTDVVATLFDQSKLPAGSAWAQRETSRRHAISNLQEWSRDNLSRLSALARQCGVRCTTLENFNPADYCDIFLDGPRQSEQVGNLLRILENAAATGFTHIGFAANPPGVFGRTSGIGRGGAKELQFDLAKVHQEAGIPRGTFWNWIVDPDNADGYYDPIDKRELLQRYRYLMDVLLHAAESLELKLCLHPPDPPIPWLSGSERLAISVQDFDALFESMPSPSHQVLLCTGTFQEMNTVEDVCAAFEHFWLSGRLGYMHIRNVKGKAPNYREVFPDEGDLPMARLFGKLTEVDYDGVLIPDHTPEMSVGEPWHAGMAFAVGYLRGLEEMSRAVHTSLVQ